MTVLTGETLTDAGIDGIALKPSEVDVRRVRNLDVRRVTVDYEGADHVPPSDAFASLAEEFDVRATIPVRADGFDPLGDDGMHSSVLPEVGEVFVAGHPAYLTERERRRAVAPRMSAAIDGATDPWIGTEGIERVALATGVTQFELLSDTTASDVRALRTAGFDGEIAVYAPTVLTGDEDAILDAVGEYAARRQPVRESLPGDAPFDSRARGDARETLLSGCREYALVGDVSAVRRQVEALHDAGVDHVVSYPARGLDAVLPS
jgi:hypothetical protein